MTNFYCYILSNKNRTVLYIGYTDNLKRRLLEHKKGNGALFTKKYNVTDLVYFETFNEIKKAKSRERQLKNWRKEWKWNLLKEANPKLETLDINKTLK
ncbi:GIY-YIG nuclease family protein [Thalassobellus citreus]|uniref:GIY-YIG nuclease family protein n=1 Tax=Thalassobellus citreus TaxID=3367752 RepID=UPI0037BC9CAC